MPPQNLIINPNPFLWFLDRYDFSGANFSKFDLSYALLRSAYGDSANCQGTDFSNANLTGITLTNAACEHAIFNQANLMNANLSNSIFSDACLVGANLRGAELMGTNFRGANLTNANMVGFKMTPQPLSFFAASFDGANFSGVQFFDRQNLTSSDLITTLKTLSRIDKGLIVEEDRHLFRESVAKDLVRALKKSNNIEEKIELINLALEQTIFQHRKHKTTYKLLSFISLEQPSSCQSILIEYRNELDASRSANNRKNH